MSDNGSDTKANKPAFDRLSRLQKLKQKKVDSERLNKQELFQDYKDQKQRSIDIQKMEKEKEKAIFENDKLLATERGEDFERKNNLKWSIKEWEGWEKKQKAVKSKQAKVGYNNFDQLAEQSYEKEILNLDISKDDYKEQKQALMKKYDMSEDDYLKPNNISNFDFHDKTRESSKNSLSKSIKDANERRMKRRRDNDEESDVSSYINDKNRQFNQKLNRQYGEK